MSCPCQKCKPLPPAPTEMQLKSLALVRQNPLNVNCPPGYIWSVELARCIKEPPPPITWECINGDCFQRNDSFGQYRSLAECQANCGHPPPPNTWDCFNGNCYVRYDGLGQFSSLEACQANCIVVPPPDTWDCTPLGCTIRKDGLGRFATIGECMAVCPQPPPPICNPVPICSIDPPDGTFVKFPTYVFIKCSRPDAKIYYSLDGTTAVTPYTGPIYLTDLPAIITAVAQVESCPFGPPAHAVYTNTPLIDFMFICSTIDKAGVFDVFTGDGSPDYNWRLTITPAGLAFTVDFIEIYETNEFGYWKTGQSWGTKRTLHPDEIAPSTYETYPLVIYTDGNSPTLDFTITTQYNTNYVNTGLIVVPPATTDPIYLSLFGQPFEPLSAGYFKIRVHLSDGSILEQVIKAQDGNVSRCTSVEIHDYCFFYDMTEAAGTQRNDSSFNALHLNEALYGLNFPGHSTVSLVPTADYTGNESMGRTLIGNECVFLHPDDTFTFGMRIRGLYANSNPIFEFLTDGSEAGSWRLRWVFTGNINTSYLIAEFDLDGHRSSGIYPDTQYQVTLSPGLTNFTYTQTMLVFIRYNNVAGIINMHFIFGSPFPTIYDKTTFFGFGKHNHIVTGGAVMQFGVSVINGVFEKANSLNISRTFLIKRILTDAECLAVYGGTFIP